MIAYRAARVLADGIERRGWWVGVDGSTIAYVGPEAPTAAERVDLGDVDLVPGFVDLHSDCLEELAHPRPTADLPLDETLIEFDALVVAHGITTSFLCINLDDDARKWRTSERSIETEATLRRVAPLLRADHRIHLRVDITAEFATGLMRRLCAGGLVGLLSYMDHTPGSGQFRDEASWRKWYGRNMDDDALDAALAQKLAGQYRSAASRREISRCAHEIGAALASHDDDTPEKVALANSLGVHIAEFPVNELAARDAAGRGLGILMGAPNARRGRSHSNNLSAREALAAGALHALASDYHPPSLLAAVYVLARDGVCSWADAVALVSSGPARIVGLNDRGCIAVGKRADLAAIDVRDDLPIVRQTWVHGMPAFGVTSPTMGARIGAGS
jgi:alpha-D-ribose 1-methylphosphonate 5-triphosphate diphosphatase